MAVCFIASELAFESELSCLEFLEAKDVLKFVEEKDDSQGNKSLRLRAKEALVTINQLRAGAFKKVDIKGQI